MHSITLWGVGMNVIKEKEDDPPNEPPDIGIDGIGHADHGDLPLPTVLGRSEPSPAESPPRASRNSDRTRWWFQRFVVFIPYLGKIPILTNIFQRGWKHQLEEEFKQMVSCFQLKIDS